MTRIARLGSIGRTRRTTVTLVGTAAAVILGVSGALAAGAPDDGGTDTSGGTTVGVTSGSDGEPTPAPAEGPGSTPDPNPSPSPGASDGAGDAGGPIGGVSGGGGPTEYPDPSGQPSPTPSDDLAGLTERIGELEAKVDQLPTKQELADALRAFADQLDNGGQSGN